MKKILLLFMMCALLPMTVGAQTPTNDTFEVSELTWDNDMEGYYFTVSLAGVSSNHYTAYNLDIILPNGIEVMNDPENGYYVLMSENSDFYTYNKVKKTWSHTVECSMPNVHQLRVACYSGSNVDFKDVSGELFFVYVTIENSAFTSSFSPKPIVKLSGMSLVKSDESQYIPADFSCRPFTTGIPTARTLPVNISSGNKIGTLILPFATTLPSGLKAYSCNSLEGDKLTLTAAASIEACTPYIVYAENGYSGNLTGTANLTDDQNVTDVFTDGYLTGVLTGTIVNTGYILQNKGAGPMFYDAEGVNFNLPAGRCYLTPPTTPSSGVKSFAFNFDTPTGIEEFQGTPLPNRGGAGGEAIFDIYGRKVSSPARGIYIQGTRKVVVK